MTKREDEIVNLIREDPMISQNDIASILGITRSSVSVHINNLVKKGIIKGRGYIITDERPVIVIGAANFDLIVCLNREEFPFLLDPKQISNISGENSKISFAYGGTAKIIAELLVKLDLKACLFAAMAEDMFGREILADCKKHGISTEGCLIDPDSQTSMYLELRNTNQIPYAKTANVMLERKLTPSYLETKRKIIANADCIVVDDGMSVESLEYIAANYREPYITILNGFAAGRCEKYRNILSQISVFVLSLECALCLSGEKPEFPESGIDNSYIQRIAQKVLQAGAKKVIIPYGADRICMADLKYCYICAADDLTAPCAENRVRLEAVTAGYVYSQRAELDAEHSLAAMSAINFLHDLSDTDYTIALSKESLESFLDKTVFNITKSEWKTSSNK